MRCFILMVYYASEPMLCSKAISGVPTLYLPNGNVVILVYETDFAQVFFYHVFVIFLACLFETSFSLSSSLVAR